MRTLCTGMLLAVVASSACSKDKPEPAPAKTAAAPGVGLVSANELGPQKRHMVTVSSTSSDAVAEFERGRELMENVRQAEAAEKFRRAVKLDPDFALAHAYLGFAGDRKNSSRHFERALELADQLPKPEALVIRGMIARRKGDRLEEAKIYTELSELKPKDWRVAMWVGDAANRLGKLDDAIAAYEKAIELEPKGAETYNQLAYAHASRNELVAAAAAAAKYAELKPDEPNPHDSLGEILMLSGRFEEAEAAFRRAVEVAPTFTISWEGVALTHIYRGNWAEAVEALERARGDAAEYGQQVRLARAIAFAHLGGGDVDKALATVDALDAEIKARGGSEMMVEAPLLRADIHFARGKLKHAVKAIDEASARIEGLEPKGQRVVRRYLLASRVRVEVAMGKRVLAEKSLAQLEALESKEPNPTSQGALHYARGLVALAKGDASAAAMHLEKIGAEDPRFLDAKWKRAAALEKSGEQESARRLRAEVERSFRRHVGQAFERNRLVGTSG